MARLNSIDEKDFLEIKINSFENKLESSNEDWKWIISNLHFYHKDKKIINTIGSYFDLGEIKTFVENIRQLLDKRKLNYESNFLEPNLKLLINTINKTYLVEAYFSNGPSFENSNYKRVKIITSQENLIQFVNQIEKEILSLLP